MATVTITERNVVIKGC